jgi:hypothetical protein
MITIEVERHGVVAVDEDDEKARYEVVDRLRASRPAVGLRRDAPARALVEVQLRFGGLAPRGLIGGQFIPGPGEETLVEVGVSGIAVLDSKDGLTCSSRLWSQPFIIGLPPDFTDAVLRELADHNDPVLPPGILIVDRAGFDVVNSSSPIFAQAAATLRAVLTANLYDRDVEADVRALVNTWW